MKILIVGDVFSKLGRASLERNLKKLREQEKINFVIVNAENTSHGKGLNQGHYKWYMELGVNVLTLGNHSFQNRSILGIIDDVNNIIRPLNYVEPVRGKGYVTVNYNNLKITVLQVMGTLFMNGEYSSPFVAVQGVLDNTNSDIYICDYHGEATSEKIAFGYYFDGKIQVIIGTHTHVQTNDGRILPNGTAYITDVGMTGPLNGVIGVKKEIIIDRLINDGRMKFEPEDKGVSQFSAVIVEIDDVTHKVAKIDTIHVIE